MAIRGFTLRIEEELLRKIQYVAKYEGRSINSQILILIRECIKEFEEEQGEKIELD